MRLTRPNGTYFKSNYGRWAHLDHETSSQTHEALEKYSGAFAVAAGDAASA
jgi:hypothetical protein